MEPVDYPYRRYSQYRTTSQGERVLDNLAADLPVNHSEFVRSVRQFVTTRSFTRLLRDVYAEYPQFAVNSRLRG